MTAGSDSFFIRSPLFSPQLPLILGRTTLNLKALALGADAPFVPGNSFPNLVNLQLRGARRAFEVTASDLLALLSNCPRVETFELGSPIPDIKRDAQMPELTLSHLKALWMNKLNATTALAFLAKLKLPAVSTVRLTDLCADQWLYPPCPLPLSHMGLTQLDILESGKPAGRDTPFALHFIAHRSGTSTGLWIHLSFWRPNSRSDGLPVGLSEQYTHEELVFWDVFNALPTRTISELRLSMLRPAHLTRAALIVLRERVPALEGLVVRGLKARSATEQCKVQDGLARALARRDVAIGPSEAALGSWTKPGQSVGDTPVPRLRDLTIELNRAWKSGMGDRLVRALQERKKRGYPLRSVACSAPSVGDEKLEECIREHVTGEVNITNHKLWKVRKVSEIWMVKNDYWRLYPESLARGLNGWGLPGNT